MRTLQVFTGYSCNVRCTFCSDEDQRAHIPDKTFEQVAAPVREFAGKASKLILIGGESTLRPDLPDILRLAKRNGYAQVQLVTNGLRFSDAAYLDGLVAAGLDAVQMAFHSVRRETADALAGGVPVFDRQLAALGNLRDRARRGGLAFSTSTVIVRQNLAELPAVAAFLSRAGAGGISFTFVHPVGYAAAGPSLVRPADAAPAVNALLRRCRRSGIPVSLEKFPLCLIDAELRDLESRRANAYVRHLRDDVVVLRDDEAPGSYEKDDVDVPQCRACSYLDFCEFPHFSERAYYALLESKYGYGTSHVPYARAFADLGLVPQR